MIQCPMCGKACGNEVDHEKQITIRCQFCGYGTTLADMDRDLRDTIASLESLRSAVLTMIATGKR
jgi:hypothetical protein